MPAVFIRWQHAQRDCTTCITLDPRYARIAASQIKLELTPLCFSEIQRLTTEEPSRGKPWAIFLTPSEVSHAVYRKTCRSTY